VEHGGGKVIIQTFTPDHHCVTYASKHDYCSFFDKEAVYRKSFRFPPYKRMANIRISGKNFQAVITSAKALQKIMTTKSIPIELLGPAPAPLSKIKDKFRWHIFVKCPDAKQLGNFIRNSMKKYYDLHGKQKVNIQVDIDPIFIL